MKAVQLVDILVVNSLNYKQMVFDEFVHLQWQLHVASSLHRIEKKNSNNALRTAKICLLIICYSLLR